MFGPAGCIEDADCGICDPDNLVLQSISGTNYAGKRVHLLDPPCDGPECPEPFDDGSYFIEDIGPCEATEDALESPRGAKEWCKLAPLVTDSGIEFVFNNLLDPTSVELVRKQPDNPQLFEVYDWKTRIVSVEGPITRFNGDYKQQDGELPDVVSRAVNLSCIDNLRDEGRTFSFVDYQDPETNPCNALGPNGRPRKLREDGVLEPYRGEWTPIGNSCATPTEGPDTCCTTCDFELSTRITKYGLADDAATVRSPHDGSALLCDAQMGDKYTECSQFRVAVDRSEQERTYDYYWNCDPAADPGCERDTFPTPYYDKLRETHPDLRPPWLETLVAPCSATPQCIGTGSGNHDLPGTECVGQLADGRACLMDVSAGAGCTQGFCRPQWFVSCQSDLNTTGSQGYCVDRRFSGSGTAACFRSTAQFEALCDDEGRNCAGTARSGVKMALCDGTENGQLSAAECCQAGLQGVEPENVVAACDPLHQINIEPLARYERDENLPEPTRDCICEDDFPPQCEDAVRNGGCFDAQGNLRPERAGQYAVKFVGRPGGVVYDPAVKGFEMRPSDLGGVPRATIENCAEGRGLIGQRNRHDGWRANDSFFIESYQDFDRALCSASRYTVVFEEPGEGVEFVEDKVGNTLEGKARYAFETPDFHVVPGSGVPADGQRIGACDEFSLRFSNKYDQSPENLGKLQLFRVECTKDEETRKRICVPTTPHDDCPVVAPAAGGPGCARTKAELDNGDACTAPCLQVDVENQYTGRVAVRIDPTEFGSVLGVGEVYRLAVPGLGSPDDMTDPTAYQSAFWDACGMPLILGGASEEDFLYEFEVDKPKCNEDEDLDRVQLSCDNAPLIFNPDQGDMDRDGVGDIIDLCPTVITPISNGADSDKDGVGNECDSCRRTISSYNVNSGNGAVPFYMQVRNIPFQTDTDGDGIGDVCDNCVTVANCQEYGAPERWFPGDPIAFDQEAMCQSDKDSDMIGSACDGSEEIPGAPMPNPNAAGIVGFMPDDDFDQDGVANMEDLCPRQPVPFVDCSGDGLCPDGSACSGSGVCNHADSDGDDVGDICDTCPVVANPMQIVDGGAQEDDADGDFVGSVCETSSGCAGLPDARPYSFHSVALDGNCCFRQLIRFDELTAEEQRDAQDEIGETPTLGPDDLVNGLTKIPILDPDRLPIRVACTEEETDAMICRAIPPRTVATHGIVVLPPGCDEALVAAGITEDENRVRLNDGSPSVATGALPALDELWTNLCFIPQLDQDYDGLGELCDLCPFAFDPDDTPYQDETSGRLWPDSGQFCNGRYSPANVCARMEEDTGTGTGTGTDTGGATGDSSGGGSGG